MKKTLFVLCLLLAGCGNPTVVQNTTTSATTTPDSVNSPGPDTLMSLMKEKDAQHYQTAVDAGVEFLPTADGKSFYAFWTPDGFDASKDGFIVSMGGHDGFASADFNAWEPYLKEHHYGLLAVQWWFGSGEETTDYYTPSQIYTQIQAALTAQKIPGGRLLFEGFSRGATNTYAVEALDHAQANPLFLVTVSNAGAFMTDYPPSGEIAQGKFGSTPFQGEHWIFYCGDKDTTKGSTCAEMKTTETALKGYGAIVDLFIEDSNGGHGDFHRNSKNAEAALADYDQLLKQ